MKKVLLGLIAIVFAINVVAQERTITGTVSDEMGPVADITVKVKSTSRGTVTDFDGNYTIKAKTGDILEFTHVSYATVTKKVGSSSIINVKIKESGSSLSEVVVTAMGIRRKSSSVKLRGASSISTTEIKIGKGAINKDSFGKEGLITAGEWNDLNNWSFWNNIIKIHFTEHQKTWGFYTNHKISVNVKSKSSYLSNVPIILKKGTTTIWKTKTDVFGNAVLWISLFDNSKHINLKDFTLFVNNMEMSAEVKPENNFILNETPQSNKLEVAFVVDATGSMSDELEFLKKDLESVITHVQNQNTNLQIKTASVFYRDIGDEYIVKKSNFTENLSQTAKFVKEQRADGGGDFPEAVHTALSTTINELSWSDEAKTKIAFLILDAPPHNDVQIKEQLHKTIKKAAAKGIKIIPITASGIDKNTEFLMRFMAITTNGTYVFITDDSGIGNSHLIASVGDFKVEILKNLIIRLISNYSTNNKF